MRQQQRTVTTAATQAHRKGATAPTSVVAVATPDGQVFVEAALRQAVPRRVRTTRSWRAERLVIWNVIVGLVLIALYLFVSAGGEHVPVGGYFMAGAAVLSAFFALHWETARRWQARLLRHGVAVTGTVAPISLDAANRGTDTIRYTYRTPDGKERTRTVNVPYSVVQRFAPGQECTILYNPARPQESFPYRAITDAEVE